jgi:small ligand-binding sensory domain FIST
MAVRIAYGSSQHGATGRAARDAACQARNQLGGLRPDLALVFATGRHLDASAPTLAVVRDVLQPRSLAGGGSSAVLAGGEQLAEETSIVVWAAHFDGGSAEVTHIPGYGQHSWPSSLAGASAVLLFPDYYSFPVGRRLPELATAVPGVPILGGCFGTRTASGGTVLLADEHTASSGMVMVTLHGVELIPFVAEGQVPIGPELVVSAADRHVVHEIAGRPAMETLQAALNGLTAAERRLLDGGFNLGLVRTGRSPSWTTHKILSTDSGTGSITVGAVLDSGQAVRLLANSATFAAAEIRGRLELCRQALGGQDPAGLLLFTCTSRDAPFFGRTGYDAAVASETFRPELVSGFVSQGEIGPVGGGPRLLGLTAAGAVFPRLCFFLVFR